MKKKIKLVPVYKQRHKERLLLIENSTLTQKEIEELLRELNTLHSEAEDDKEHVAQLSAIIDLLNTQVGQLATVIALIDSHKKIITEFIEGEITFLEALSLLPPDGGWRQILRACANGESLH